MVRDGLLTCHCRSRTSWKNVRDAEAQIAPRRAIRNNLIAQINKLKTEGGKAGGVDTRLADLDAQLKKAEADDAPLENELELLKRTAIKESETMKWKALQEASPSFRFLAFELV
jgi:Eisosome component PIL1